jgi:transcription elongation GreA/GreB family factor
MADRHHRGFFVARVAPAARRAKGASPMSVESRESRPKSRDQTVAVGSWVKVKDDLFDEEEVFRIGESTDPESNRLASSFDLGRALIGARPGDEVAVEGPKGTVTFEVLEVGKE